MMQVVKWFLLAAVLSIVLVPLAAEPKARRERKGGEHRMEAAAQRIPGFAGLYYDLEGKLNVNLVGSHGVDAARRHFGPDVRLRHADYSFAQLQGWRNRVREVLRLSNVVYVDLDEQRNRIVVVIDELSSPSARDEVVRELNSYGLPPGLIVVETKEAAKEAALLTDDIRPQPGGVEIDASPSGVCTLGFNVSFEAGQGFVTCAHCTSIRGEVNDDYVGWGVEVRDPSYWTGTFNGITCPSGRWCRFSDSALIHYAFVVENGAGASIARPNARGNSPCPNSITIDATEPTLTVIDTDDSPIMNQAVDKIGRTTGWTAGTVTDTCIDLNLTAVVNGVSRNLTYICVHEANTKLSPGDSGSPVFEWDENDGATLMGMIFAGGSSCSSHAYWADVDAIDYEVGPMTIEVDP